jgi:hypothetical protein
VTKLETIATKARTGEELSEEEVEYVAELLYKLGPLLEQTWQWFLPMIQQVIAIWLDALKKLEEEVADEQPKTPSRSPRSAPTSRH